VSQAGTTFCFACGGNLAVSGRIVASTGQMPTPALSPQAGGNAGGPIPIAAARSTEITLLAVGVSVTAVITLLVAIDLLRWAYTDIYYYDDFKWLILDGALGLGYGAASLTAFSVARGIWFVQPWAWKKACIVSLSVIGMIVVSVSLSGISGLDVFGVIGQACILGLLGQTSVRALFGGALMTPSPGPR
jgi:hypothetical protein